MPSTEHNLLKKASTALPASATVASQAQSLRPLILMRSPDQLCRGGGLALFAATGQGSVSIWARDALMQLVPQGRVGQAAHRIGPLQAGISIPREPTPLAEILPRIANRFSPRDVLRVAERISARSPRKSVPATITEARNEPDTERPEG